MAFKIEFREYNIAGFGGHNYFVLYNDSGQRIGEMHGLATNRTTGLPVAVGTNADQLRGHVFPATDGNYFGLYSSGQSAQTVFQGTQAEVMARWNAGINAIFVINNNNITYDLLSGSSSTLGVANSNSVAYTLGLVMGVETPNLSWWTWNPGDGKNLLPRENYPNLYQPFSATSSISSSEVLDTNGDGQIDKQVQHFTNGDEIAIIDVDFDGLADIRAAQTDTNADGIIDQATTWTDADHNGKAELVVKSIYGGTTTYSYDTNQNGQFENITIAQANGRFDITQTDESGAANAWKTIETHYASAGVLDDQRIVWDNNSTWLNDWDQAASQSWSYQSTQYTASGQADLQTIDWDGGARWINDWDAASSQIWSYQSTQYTAAGQADLQNITWDNGSKWINDWDAASNQIWSYQSTQYTASGQTDQQTIDWDDASRWVNDWDQGNSNITKLSTTVYTAAGALDRQTVIMDDNSTWANDWDQANANAWQTMSTLYSSSGAADWQRVGYDNGSYFTNDWDASNTDVRLNSVKKYAPSATNYVEKVFNRQQ